MPTPELADRLAEIADKNLGFVTTAQAAAAGITQRELDEAVARGALLRKFRGTPYHDGLYRTVGTSETDFFPELRLTAPFQELILATWISIELDTPVAERIVPQSGVISHRAAAVFHGMLTGTHWLEFIFPPGALDSPDLLARQLEIKNNGKKYYDVDIFLKDISSDELSFFRQIPVTTQLRTLTDLIADSPIDAEDLADIAVTMLVDRVVTKGQLEQAVSVPGSQRFLIPPEEFFSTLLNTSRLDVDLSEIVLISGDTSTARKR